MVYDKLHLYNNETTKINYEHAAKKAVLSCLSGFLKLKSQYKKRKECVCVLMLDNIEDHVHS